MVSVQTYKHIPQKRISGTAVLGIVFPKFHGNSSSLRSVTGCGYLTAVLI